MKRHGVLATTTVLFTVMVAHALLETARDALFLGRLGPGRLVWAYLGIAGSALLAFVIVRRLAGVRDPRRLLLALLGIAVAGTSLLAATITWSPSLIFVLYVWTGLVATMVVPSFWTLVDRSHAVDDAKQTFAFIGAGAISGALVGSALAALLGRVIAARHLVTAGAAVFALGALAALVLAPHPSHEQPPRRAHRQRAVPYRRTTRYLQLVTATILVSTIALTLGDLAFKRALAERLPAEDLATAFGSIYTGLNILSLLVQVVIAPRLLGRLGVGAAMVILPLILLLSAAGFALTAVTVAIVVLKLGDGGLRHSLHRVTTEILFLPVPAAVRDGSKPVVDAIGQRGGQVVAVLLVLALTALPFGGAGARALAAMAALAAIGWLVLVALARRAYVAQFGAMLAAGEIQRSVRLPRLDAHAVGILTQTLASADESEALAALALLERQPGSIPALVLYHPRSEVVRRAIALLDGDPRPDVARALDHLVGHGDPEIRAAALAASSRSGRHHEHLTRALADDHPGVRATAAVHLLGDGRNASSASARVAAMIGGSTSDRVALARAITHAPDEALRGTLGELLAQREPAVLREVLEVYARAPALADLDRLLGLLADFHVRGDVRRVFLAAGQPGFDVLVAALDDPETAAPVRRHVPRTLSRFGSAAAAAALATRLPHEADGTTEFKILRALGRMTRETPALPVDRVPLQLYLRRSLAHAARFATLLDHLDHTPGAVSPGAELLRQLLREKRSDAVERCFRVLGILHPRTDLRSVHDALTGTDVGRRGAAREIAEAVVDLEFRGALFAILDDLAPEPRRLRLGRLAAGPFRDHQDFLAELLADRSESVRAIATHYAAESAARSRIDAAAAVVQLPASP